MKRYIKYQNFEYLCNLFAGIAIMFGTTPFLLPHFTFSETFNSVFMVLLAISIIFGIINIILRLTNKKLDKGVIPNLLFVLGFGIYLFVFLSD